MFKNVDKSMLLKLVALHVIVITVSNALVAIPVEILGVKLTWAAFTFPLVVIATDLTVRLLGKQIARQTIAAAYPLAIIGSIAVVLAEGAPTSVAVRIGFASATAYAIGTMLDVYVFQYIRESKQFGKIGGWLQRYLQSRQTSLTHILSLLWLSTTVPTNTWRLTGLRLQDRRLC